MMRECAMALAAAFALDVLLGDPAYALHPVRLIGRTIAVSERLLRRTRLSGIGGGVLLVVMTLTFWLGPYALIQSALSQAIPWLRVLTDVFLVYSCIAFQDLLHHGRLVQDALAQGDLERAREVVQRIVGRDAGRLDEAGVARAAVESVAENLVDGLLSPLFWYVAGAGVAWVAGWPPCAGAVFMVLAFRVVNTLDSMVGYRSDRYLYFGRAAARLDDLMNFLPARLSVPIICVAAWLCGENVADCLRIGRRDRLKHPSPNAGHAESSVAGALGIRLGGPTVYPHGISEKPWLGDGPSEVSHEHIRRCRLLVFRAGLVAFVLSLAALVAASSVAAQDALNALRHADAFG
jgi:adenosylcobinamide-phosphate synthase